MKVIRAVLCIAFVGCTHAPLPARDVQYVNDEVRREFALGAEVDIQCLDEDGTVAGGVGGSAVIVGPRWLLTARHVVVACQEHDYAQQKIMVVLHDGSSYEARVAIVTPAPWHDVALLGVKGEPPFKQWAEVATKMPAIGEEVCLLAAVPFWARKCGTVDGYLEGQSKWLGDGYIMYHADSVHGNSGGAVYDRSGRLLAINVAVDGGGYLFERWSWMIPPLPGKDDE